MSPVRAAGASAGGPEPVSTVLVGPEVVHRLHEIRTPEGVVLPFRIATAGERLAAFFLDGVWLFGTTILLGLLLVWFAWAGASGWLVAVFSLAYFALFNGYFLFFELRPGSATPGKRRMSLRVMDARGGVLTPDAVIARNLMRNLELTLPLVVLVAPQAIGPGLPGWARIASALWLFAVAGLPLFNRQRLRAGDLVGGTIVVRAPRTILLADLTARGPARGAPVARRHAFMEAQLAVYGIYELQVLEDVLRHDEAPDAAETQRTVAERIARKIGWTATIERSAARSFLLDYYAALRERLERKALFGKRKRDKWSVEERLGDPAKDPRPTRRP